MKQFVFINLILLACTSLVFAQQLDLDDNQLWTETSVQVPLGKNLNATLTPGLRIGRDFKHFVDERATVALTYRANKNLSFASGYLYRATQPDARRRGFENRVFAAFTIAVPLGKFALGNRNSFEYRANNSRSDAFVYRNRVALERDVKFFGFGVRPLLAFETFYDSRLDRWFRQRYTISMSKRFGKKLIGEVSYTKQQDGSSRPGNLNIIGTALRFQL